MSNEKLSRIVEAFSIIFSGLKWVSWYKILHDSVKWRRVRENDKTCIEYLTLGHLFASFILWACWDTVSYRGWNCIVVLYAIYRIIETSQVQMNALLFDYYRRTKERENEGRKEKAKKCYCVRISLRILPLRLQKKAEFVFGWFTRMKERKEERTEDVKEPYVVRGYLRILLLLLLNYAEFIFWFAILYLNWNSAFVNEVIINNKEIWIPFSNAHTPLLLALNYSFVTMTTFGHTSIKVVENVGYTLTMVQSLIGLFMVLMILARFVSFLPRPPTSDKIEKRMLHACTLNVECPCGHWNTIMFNTVYSEQSSPEPKVRVMKRMYKPVEETKCSKCGRVIATPDEAFDIVKGEEVRARAFQKRLDSPRN